VSVPSAAEQLAGRLFRDAFQKPRDPRSVQYQKGAFECLYARATGTHANCPYRFGSVEADAWYAGNDEGWRIWRNHQADEAAVSA
jgi:hypothetical protein